MWWQILTVLGAAVAAITGYYATLPVPKGVRASAKTLRIVTAFNDIVSLNVKNNIITIILHTMYKLVYRTGILSHTFGEMTLPAQAADCYVYVLGT